MDFALVRQVRTVSHANMFFEFFPVTPKVSFRRILCI